jgi:hypothetical protein
MNLQEISDNLKWLYELSIDDLISIIARLVNDSDKSTWVLLNELEDIWRKSDD